MRGAGCGVRIPRHVSRIPLLASGRACADARGGNDNDRAKNEVGGLFSSQSLTAWVDCDENRPSPILDECRDDIAGTCDSRATVWEGEAPAEPLKRFLRKRLRESSRSRSLGDTRSLIVLMVAPTQRSFALPVKVVTSSPLTTRVTVRCSADCPSKSPSGPS
jgi:hypothetical protein